MMYILWKRLLDQEDAGVELHYFLAMMILLSIVVFTGYDLYITVPFKGFAPLDFGKSVSSVIVGIAGANFGLGKQRASCTGGVCSAKPLPGWIPRWVGALLDSNDTTVEFHVIISLAVLASYMGFMIINFIYHVPFDVAGYGTGGGLVIGSIGSVAWTAGMQRRDQSSSETNTTGVIPSPTVAIPVPVNTSVTTPGPTVASAQVASTPPGQLPPPRPFPGCSG